MIRAGRLVVAAVALACAGCGSTEKREAGGAPAPEPAAAQAQAPADAAAAAEAPAPAAGPADMDGALLAQAGPQQRGPVIAQAGGQGDRPRPPAGGPVGGTVREQQQRAMADSYFEAGRTLFEEMRYHDAAMQLRLAVRMDPNHAEARQLLDQTLYILGDRDAGFRDQMRRVSEETRVGIGLASMEIERLFADGQRHMARQEFPQAIERFEKVIETIQYFPYHIDKSGLRGKAEAALELAREKEQERELRLREMRQRTAREQAQHWESRNQAYHHARIQTLMEQAIHAFERTDYARAERLAEQVLEREPGHEDAERLVGRAAHARRFQRELAVIDARADEMQRLIRGVYESAVPYQTVFQFPSDSDWEAVERRAADLQRMFQTEGHTASAEEQRIRRTLDSSKITINFPGTTFRDAIEFLRDVTGINYVISRAAQDEVDMRQPEIRLRLRDITLSNALDLILNEAGGLSYRIRNDAVIINTADAEQEDLFLRFYEVSEIVTDRPNYEAPQLALSPPTTDGDGGAGAILSFDDEGDVGTGVTADMLIRLIEERLGHGTDGTVEFLGGLLMARQPLSAHTKIERLLEQLRRTTGVMVTVETMIIDVQDNFLEEIGVDFRGLPAVIPAFLGGAANQMIGYNWTNRSGDVDFRGAIMNLFSTALGSAAGTPFNLSSLGGGAFQYNVLDDFQLQAIVDAVRRRQKARMVDSPRVTVFNGQRSHMLAVTQSAYIRDVEVNQTGVTPTINPVVGVLNSGSILEVRPIVSHDRKFVTMEIQSALAEDTGRVEQRLQLNMGQGGANTDITIELPVVSLQEIRTTVMCPDGGTVILGGLKNFLKQEKYSGLPIVRNVPVLHNLFERKGYSDMKRSLIVLLKVDIHIAREIEERRFNREGSSILLQ